jgi:hypothetical protein
MTAYSIFKGLMIFSMLSNSDAVNYLTNADDTQYQIFTVDKDGRVIKDFTVPVISKS